MHPVKAKSFLGDQGYILPGYYGQRFAGKRQVQTLAENGYVPTPSHTAGAGMRSAKWNSDFLQGGGDLPSGWEMGSAKPKSGSQLASDGQYFTVASGPQRSDCAAWMVRAHVPPIPFPTSLHASPRPGAHSPLGSGCAFPTLTTEPGHIHLLPPPHAPLTHTLTADSGGGWWGSRRTRTCGAWGGRAQSTRARRRGVRRTSARWRRRSIRAWAPSTRRPNAACPPWSSAATAFRSGRRVSTHDQ